MTSNQQNSTSPNQIRKIISYKTRISSTSDYHKFFKNGLASSHVINIEYNDTVYHNTEGRDQMQARLLKVLRKAQPVKALHLHKCIVQYEDIPDKKIIQIAKKTSRVKSLSLPDYTVSKQLLEKYALWLKHARRLKRLDYVAPSCADFPNGQKKGYEASLHKLFHEIKRDRLDSLHIARNDSDEKLAGYFMKFKQYPSTLKSLAFDWRHYNNESEISVIEVEQSLKHMKELKSVSFAFRNQAQLLEPILSSIPNVSDLTNLEIEFLENENQEAELPLRMLGQLKSLNSLKLKFDFWPKDFSSVLKAFALCPLKKFYLDICAEEERNLSAIKELVTRLRGLESLTLKISNISSFKNENLLRELFEKISHIRGLKDLKLHFITPSDVEKTNLNTDFISSLKGAFVKNTKLQSFSFKFNQVESSKAFFELLNLVDKTVSSLKKLNINVGEVKLNDNEYDRITELIQKMTSIEVLKLNSLSVTISQYLQDFLDSVYEIRQLRSFELREMRGILNKASFVSLIEKFLAKRGLSKFDCGLAWDPKDAAARRLRGAQIDLKKVLRTNPELKTYPQSAAMYVYYDNDIELRWD